MPAPYILQLSPVVGIESSATDAPSEELILILTPVLKGDAGSDGGGGVSQAYVDNGDAATLASANAYTDSSLSDKADLVGGFVPASQLPSFVDDVLEGHLIDLTTFDDLFNDPYVPESGKIYLDITTNLQYRWGGSSYVVLNPSLALGETPSTAYRGDRGKIAYDHSQTGGHDASQITGLAPVATSNDYNDLDNKPSGGGSSLSFDDSRWMHNDLINSGLVGGFQNIAINAGTVDSLPVAGGFGTFTLRSSTSSNSGVSILSNIVIAGGTPSTYGLTRSVFMLTQALAARVVRSGFLNQANIATELDGTWLEILDQTAVARSTAGSIGGIESKGSAVLPLDVWLVCDVEYPTNMSARVVVFNKDNNTKYLDETFTDTSFLPNAKVSAGIKAMHSGASTVKNLVVVDYVGTGIKRPSFIVAPA